MKSDTFIGISLADAKRTMTRWLSDHKVTVKMEHPPVVTRKPAGRFTRAGHGKIVTVSILLDYVDSN
jgi:hypothetical protein